MPNGCCPTFGLIGAPLLRISSTASLFGAWDQISGPAVLFALPIAIWEFSFGIHMIVKGLKPAAATDKESTPTSSPSLRRCSLSRFVVAGRRGGRAPSPPRGVGSSHLISTRRGASNVVDDNSSTTTSLLATLSAAFA